MDDFNNQIDEMIKAAEQIAIAKNGEDPETTPKEAQSGLDVINDIFIPIFGTEDEKESYHEAEMSEDAKKNLYSKEGYIVYAVWEFKMYGNIKPFEMAIKAGNPHLLKNEKVRDILVSLINGERPSKHLLRRRDRDITGMMVVGYIDVCRMQGYPVYNESKKDQESAIQRASKIFHLSPEAIRKHIWEIREKTRIASLEKKEEKNT